MSTSTQVLPRARTFPRIGNIRDWRIGQKLLLAFLALAVLPLVFTGYVSVTSSRDALLKQGDTNVMNSTAEIGAQLNLILEEQAAYIAMLGQMSEFKAVVANTSDAAVKATAQKALAAANNKLYYDSVALVNSEGTIVLSSADGDVGTKIPFRDYFLQAMKGNIFISNPSVSVITNQPAIFFSAPILTSGGQIIGVVRSRVNLDVFWNFIEDDKDIVGPGSFAMLLDENGIRLATSLSKGNRAAIQNSLLFRSVAPLSDETKNALIAENRFGANTAQRLEAAPLPEVAEAMKSPDPISFDTWADNSTIRHRAAITKLAAKPWYFLIMAPIPMFTQAADNLAATYVAIVLFVIAIAGAVAYFMARGFTTPIVQLTQVADRISLGELDAKVEIDRKDEIGELAEAVSRMQASLQAAIERLRARRSNS